MSIIVCTASALRQSGELVVCCRIIPGLSPCHCHFHLLRVPFIWHCVPSIQVTPELPFALSGCELVRVLYYADVASTVKAGEEVWPVTVPNLVHCIVVAYCAIALQEWNTVMLLRLYRGFAPLVWIIALHSRVHPVFIVTNFSLSMVLKRHFEVSCMSCVELWNQVFASAFLSAVLPWIRAILLHNGVCVEEAGIHVGQIAQTLLISHWVAHLFDQALISSNIRRLWQGISPCCEMPDGVIQRS